MPARDHDMGVRYGGGGHRSQGGGAGGPWLCDLCVYLWWPSHRLRGRTGTTPSHDTPSHDTPFPSFLPSFLPSFYIGLSDAPCHALNTTPPLPLPLIDCFLAGRGRGPSCGSRTSGAPQGCSPSLKSGSKTPPTARSGTPYLQPPNIHPLSSCSRWHPVTF